MENVKGFKMIQNYEDFISMLRVAGMSMGGDNNEGVFSLSSYFESNILWHTEDKETDPWEWRIRVLNETGDIAYGKLFFKKSGFITKEWYPYFYAIRRNNNEFDDEYETGNLSYLSKRIYQLFNDNESIPIHIIKQELNITKEDKSMFDKAVIELQTKMYLTMCGNSRKISSKGQVYGWSSTVFCKTESFFGDEVIETAKSIKKEDAYKVIWEHIYSLNHEADEKKVKKFILG